MEYNARDRAMLKRLESAWHSVLLEPQNSLALGDRLVAETITSYPPIAYAWANLIRGYALIYHSSPGPARVALRGVVAANERAGSARIGWIAAVGLAICDLVSGRFEFAEAALQGLVDAIPEEVVAGDQAHAFNGLAICLARRGEHARALANSIRALGAAQAADEPALRLLTMSNLASRLYAYGHLDVAAQLLAAARRLAASLRLPERGAISGTHLAFLSMTQGRREEGFALIDELVKSPGMRATPHIRPLVYSVVAYRQLLGGEYETASRYVSLAQEELTDYLKRPWEAVCDVLQARIELAMGRPDMAGELARRALGAVHSVLPIAYHRRVIAELAQEVGDLLDDTDLAVSAAAEWERAAHDLEKLKTATLPALEERMPSIMAAIDGS